MRDDSAETEKEEHPKIIPDKISDVLILFLMQTSVVGHRGRRNLDSPPPTVSRSQGSHF